MKKRLVVLFLIIVISVFMLVACGDAGRTYIIEYESNNTKIVEVWIHGTLNDNDKIQSKTVFFEDGSMVIYEFSFEGSWSDKKTTITQIDPDGNVILFDKK